MKNILLIIFLFLNLVLHSENLIFNKKEPAGIKFKPLYYIKIEKKNLDNVSYFLIGNTEKYGLL